MEPSEIYPLSKRAGSGGRINQKETISRGGRFLPNLLRRGAAPIARFRRGFRLLVVNKVISHGLDKPVFVPVVTVILLSAVEPLVAASYPPMRDENAFVGRWHNITATSVDENLVIKKYAHTEGGAGEYFGTWPIDGHDRYFSMGCNWSLVKTPAGVALLKIEIEPDRLVGAAEGAKVPPVLYFVRNQQELVMCDEDGLFDSSAQKFKLDSLDGTHTVFMPDNQELVLLGRWQTAAAEDENNYEIITFKKDRPIGGSFEYVAERLKSSTSESSHVRVIGEWSEDADGIVHMHASRIAGLEMKDKDFCVKYDLNSTVFALSHKREEWRFEQEYRLIALNEYVLVKGRIRRVMLGPRCNETIETAIRRLAPPKCEVCRTKLDQNRREIVIKRSSGGIH